MKLLEHQVSTLQHAQLANQHGHGTMLFHSMGTGKTITVLSICLSLFPKRPIVVFAPSYLKSIWDQEKQLVNKNAVLSMKVYSVDTLTHITREMSKDAEKSIVIVDEAHYLQDLMPKNPDIFRFLRSFYRAYFLTGTPFRKIIDELAVYVNILAKKTVIPSSVDHFKKKFTIPLTRSQKAWNNWCVQSFATVSRMVLFVRSFLKTVPTSFTEYWIEQALYPIMVWIVGAISSSLLFQPGTNVKAMAEVIRPYVTITSGRGIKSNSLSFPDVTKTREFFSYTKEQREKLVDMLSQQEGNVTNKNVNNMYGTEIPHHNRNVMLAEMISKLSGGNSKTGGSEISRLSGWWRTAVPSKFEYVARLCARRRRVVLYSRFQTVAARLVDYLIQRGFGPRIQNLNQSYPKIDIVSIQSKFYGNMDIVVMHPKMTEGISIKGASTLVTLEPFADAASKQQLEARVVRLGSHALVDENLVEIVTCVTGIDLVTDPFEEKSAWRLIRDNVIEKYRSVVSYVKTFKFEKFIEMPPWMQLADLQHLQFGPEVSQEMHMKSLEGVLDSFRLEAEGLLRAPNSSLHF
jgi:hypothetical protein